MKKLLCCITLIFALICLLASCSNDDPDITVNEDGYVVVNGVKTEYLVEKADAISAEDGYLFVNGVKTTYKLYTEPVISVVDGYIAVNGIKTAYKVNQEPEGCAHTFGANGICTICNAADPKRIEYSVNFGTRIDTLSISEREIIDAYVADCKTLYKVGYAPITLDTRLDLVPYLSFTDVLIYDFRDVDENTLDSKSLTLWENLKKYYTESRPLMYIELAGYHTYFNSDILTPIQSGSIIYGFFIFEDETVIRQTYNRLCSTVYAYKLIEGTKFINCGDKYAEDFNEKQFNNWVNSALEIENLQDLLIKLHIDE
jgi:hypothetical protein